MWINGIWVKGINDRKPLQTFFSLTALSQAVAKRPGKDHLLKECRVFWLRKSEQALLYALFRGPMTDLSRGCKAWVVRGGRFKMWILFWMASSRKAKLLWEEWPSKMSNCGLCSPHPFKKMSVNHFSPISSFIHPFVWKCHFDPAGAALVLKSSPWRFPFDN